MLKAAREAMQLRVEDASHALHIRARYLQALEEGKLEELPGQAYAKGYLLAYAGFLDMDRQEILRQFEKIEASFKRGFFLPEVLSSDKKASPNLVWGGVVVAILAYVAWQSLGGFSYGNEAETAAIQQQIEEKQPHFTLLRQNVSCLKPQAVLYPPCYAVEPDFDLLPLQRRVRSVVELAM